MTYILYAFSYIIPTYNEIENIPKIIPAVLNVIPDDAGVLVVDDSSPDGTGNAVKEMQALYAERLFLLERKEKSGLASAYIAGFKWGFEAGYDVLCEMDADFSHKPEYLSVLYENVQTYCCEISFSKANAVRSTENNGYRIQDGDWFTVRNSIFKKDNWRQLKVQNDVLLEE